MARRTIVAGAGLAAGFWLGPLARRPDVEIVAVVDPHGERAAALLAEHRLACPAFADLGQALRRTAPDLAVNCTPPGLHRAVIEALLAAGCDVLTEKPLATTFADALAIVEAAAAAGRVLSVMQNRRHQPAIVRLREGIGTGAIGRTVLLCADMFMAPARVPAYLAGEPHPLLLEMAIHTFDQARFLSGEEAVSVTCLEPDARHPSLEGPAAAIATFALTGGVTFSYRGSWAASGFETSWDAAWRIAGDRGTAVWDSFGAPQRMAGAFAGAWDLPRARDLTGHAAAVDALLDALAAGRRAATDGRDNLESLAMVFAAIRSAEERRPVALEEIRAG